MSVVAFVGTFVGTFVDQFVDAFVDPFVDMFVDAFVDMLGSTFVSTFISFISVTSSRSLALVVYDHDYFVYCSSKTSTLCSSAAQTCVE